MAIGNGTTSFDDDGGSIWASSPIGSTGAFSPIGSTSFDDDGGADDDGTTSSRGARDGEAGPVVGAAPGLTVGVARGMAVGAAPGMAIVLGTTIGREAALPLE
uniref:Uncharacterized protein n=1 Tax=Oryza glumipatula TaxID=40148 RepID=A0A0E0BT10_9ORYZ